MESPTENVTYIIAQFHINIVFSFILVNSIQKLKPYRGELKNLGSFKSIMFRFTVKIEGKERKRK